MGTPRKSEIRPSRIVIIAFVFFLEPGLVALAQGAHVHGVAELNVVREDKTVQIEFISPAANLLGFERMPATAEEWTLLATVIEKIETSTWLLGDDLADCKMQVENLELPSFSAASQNHDHDHDHDHDQDKDDHAEESASDTHVEFRMQYLFACSRELPSQLQITAFQGFPGIEQITVQWLIEGAAGFTELRATAPILSLE